MHIKSKGGPAAFVISLALTVAAASTGCPAAQQPADSPPAKPNEAGVLRGSQFVGEVPDAALDYPAKWALIIGIDGYAENSGLNRLHYAVGDAAAVRDVLREEFGFSKSHIRFLSEAEAKKPAIEEALRAWSATAPPGAEGARPGPDDLVVVFFAGHGLEKDGHGYLAAFDSTDDTGSCLPVSSLREHVAAMATRHKLILLDSCFSASLFTLEPAPPAVAVDAPKGVGPKGTKPIAAGSQADGNRGAGPSQGLRSRAYYLQHPAFYGFSAGRFEPVADRARGGNHSPFTTALLAVLRQRANSTSDDHAFRFTDLANQVQDAVAVTNPQIPRWLQLGPGDGEIIFRPNQPDTRQTPREKDRTIQAEQSYTRAVTLLKEGKTEYGLLTLARAFETSPVNATPLRGEITLQLGAWGRLAGHPRSSLATLGPHGTVVATGEVDGSIRLWSGSTGEPLGPPIGHPKMVTALAISLDGRFLLSSGVDGTARLWSTTTGAAEGPPLPLPGSVSGIAFSADGRWFLTVSGDNKPEIRRWSVVGARAEGAPLTPASAVNAAVFSPDGRSIMIGCVDGSVLILDASTGQAIGPPIKQEDPVYLVAISPDATTLATVTNRNRGPNFRGPGELRLWKTADRSLIGDAVPVKDEITALAFSPNSRNILAAGLGQGLQWWKVEEFPARAGVVQADETVLAVTFDQDGKRWLTCGRDHTVRAWDAAKGARVGAALACEPAAFFLDFRPGTSGLLSGRGYETGRDVLGLGEVGNLVPPRAPAIQPQVPVDEDEQDLGGDIPEQSLISPDHRFVVTWGGGGGPRLNEAQSGNPIPPFMQSLADTTAVALSPDIQRLLVGRRNGTVRLWNLTSRRPAGEALTLTGSVDAVAFCPDGKAFATAASPEPPGPFGRLGAVKELIEFWDTESRQRIGAPLKLEFIVGRMTYCPDGESLLFTSFEGKVEIVGKAGNVLLGPITPPEPARLAVIGNDGQHLLIVGERGRDGRCDAFLWDRGGQGPKGRPLVHKDRILAAALSSDGSKAATGCADGFARIWDARTGDPIGDPLLHDGPVRAVAFSRDGTRLFTKGLASTVRAWDVATGRLQGPGPSRLGPDLRDERQVDPVAFSPDGETILTTHDGRSPTEPAEGRLWKATTGVATGRPLDHKGMIMTAAFSADGRLVATAGIDRTAKLWIAAEGTPRGAPLGSEQFVWALAFAPSGRVLATGTGPGPLEDVEGQVRLWPVVDAEKGLEVKQLTMRGPVRALAFGPDDRLAIVAGVGAGHELVLCAPGSLRQDGEAIRPDVSPRALAFSRDGRFLAAGGPLRSSAFVSSEESDAV